MLGWWISPLLPRAPISAWSPAYPLLPNDWVFSSLINQSEGALAEGTSSQCTKRLSHTFLSLPLILPYEHCDYRVWLYLVLELQVSYMGCNHFIHCAYHPSTYCFRAGKMAQGIEVLAVQDWLPHGGRRELTPKLPSNLYIYTVACICHYWHTSNTEHIQ